MAAAKRLEDLGCDFVIHHIGYDERRGLAAAGKPCPSPLDQLREVVAAVRVPVQAVGGLSIEQAIRTPEYGAPLVVLGAPLTIDADSFKTAIRQSRRYAPLDLRKSPCLSPLIEAVTLPAQIAPRTPRCRHHCTVIQVRPLCGRSGHSRSRRGRAGASHRLSRCLRDWRQSRSARC